MAPRSLGQLTRLAAPERQTTGAARFLERVCNGQGTVLDVSPTTVMSPLTTAVAIPPLFRLSHAPLPMRVFYIFSSSRAAIKLVKLQLTSTLTRHTASLFRTAFATKFCHALPLIQTFRLVKEDAVR
jgi:hypothetical protein